MTAERVPPHDLDAEAIVLSESILDADQFALVGDKLTPEHFYSEANRRIFEAVVGLTQDGRTVDLVAVAGWLRDRERLVQVGGSAYLAQILDGTPSHVHVEQHAARVLAFYRARTLIVAAQRIAALGYHVAGDEVQTYLDESERTIYDIAQGGELREIASIEQVLRESYDALLAAEARGGAVELPTGLHKFDQQIGGLGRGRVTVIAGRPGMGKTALVTGAAETIAQLGEPVAIFSLEMPRRQLGMRMACCRSGASVHRALNGWLGDEERIRLLHAKDELRGLPIWIDDTPAIGLMQIRARCRQLATRSRRKLALVVVDYLQLMSVQSRAGGSRDRELSEITAGMKRLSKELDCAVVLLSQLNRECEAERDKRPRMHHLRESGGIEQDADDVVFVYRDEYYFADSKDKNVAELIVAKQRNGPTGTVRVRFMGGSTAFQDLQE